MVARVKTVAFQGIDVKDIDVQVQISSGGMVAFTIVGLPDKAVGESRERVRAALNALGLSLPLKRITVNLAPADLLKEGSHFDLAIAVALLAAMGVLPADELAGYTILGELALDGQIAPVAGVLPAAMAAVGEGRRGVICPAACGGEAAWAGALDVLAPASLIALVNHFKGNQVLTPPEPALAEDSADYPDLADIKGQETARRALEVAAAGGHNLLMVGPPGAGKSMLAQRLPGILPPLDPAEALEVSMIASVAGALAGGRITRRRPFRDPHHSASLPALVGGGLRARPGEVSLAHKGVLFLDELPEFNRQTLEALRQPIESGRAVVARANHHVTYPARFQLVAAMNPCKCGWLDDAAQACTRAPRCAREYQARISGPLFDRIDLHVDVPAVAASDLSLPPPRETSADVAARVARVRAVQRERYRAAAKREPCLAEAGAGAAPEPTPATPTAAGPARPGAAIATNAEADGDLLERVAAPDAAGRELLTRAADRMRLSARGYHRVLRVARTLADMDGADAVGRVHVAEAVSYRRVAPGG